MRTKAIALALVMLIAPACVPGYVRDNNSPVMFRITSINAGATITVSVGVAGTTTTSVTLAVRAKSPLNTNVPQVPEAVFLDHYQVRFTRTDGHNVEGVDVPYGFTGALTGVIDIATSGGTSFVIPVVRGQALQEPPLSNLLQQTGANATSPLIVNRITMTAEITVFGRTVAREAVSDTGFVTVDFVGQ